MTQSMFLALVAVALLPLTVPQDTSRTCPLVCQGEYKPVCGSDGRTYLNICILKVRNCRASDDDQVTIVRLGACKLNTNARLKLPKRAQPETSPRACPTCPGNFEPVCGSDGVTYFNRCLLLSVNCQRPPNDHIQLVSEGPCQTSTTPTPYPYK